jgi:hypothetical protein
VDELPTSPLSVVVRENPYSAWLDPAPIPWHSSLADSGAGCYAVGATGIVGRVDNRLWDGPRDPLPLMPAALRAADPLEAQTMPPSAQQSSNSGESPTGLDAPEIPVESIPATTLSSDDPDAQSPRYLARHSGWAARRQRTAEALVRAGYMGPRLEAFQHCGQRAWLLRSKNDPDLYRWVADYCHDRFCVPCAGARSSLIAANLAAHIHDQPCRLITLTLRNTPPPLRPTLDRLYLEYRRLRQRKLWKTSVTGAIAFLEVTWNAITHTWHPHLHVLAFGRFIEKQLLKRDWLAVTGDSYIVDLKLVRDASKVISYVAKYATKTHTPAIEQSVEVYADLIRGLNGRRLLLASGDCTSWNLLDDHSDDEWDYVCHVNGLYTTDRLDPDLVPSLLASYEAWSQGSQDDTYRVARSPPPPEVS